MPVGVKKREGENFNSLLYRFNKRIRQSGILKEARKRRFHRRKINRNKRRLSALYRAKKEQEFKKLRRYKHGTGSRGF